CIPERVYCDSTNKIRGSLSARAVAAAIEERGINEAGPARVQLCDRSAAPCPETRLAIDCLEGTRCGWEVARKWHPANVCIALCVDSNTSERVLEGARQECRIQYLRTMWIELGDETTETNGHFHSLKSSIGDRKIRGARTSDNVCIAPGVDSDSCDTCSRTATENGRID